jgi:hypothetical protein
VVGNGDANSVTESSKTLTLSAGNQEDYTAGGIQRASLTGFYFYMDPKKVSLRVIL